MGSSHELNMAATPGYNSNEVWFKAAIIAVPICGVVILFLLIFLAVKILRTDSMSASNKLEYVHNSLYNLHIIFPTTLYETTLYQPIKWLEN